MSGRLDSDSHNRIFILGARSLSPDELRSAFEKFGTIVDVRMLKDRITRENKGISYITYEKASEAALAIEQMNGQFVSGLDRPIKVLLANKKREGSVRDPEEDEKMKRLFIMVPEGQTKDDIKLHFETFGNVEYIKVLQKNSGSVQLAYVKFSSAYHAAMALENCDENYKAKFAETSWNSKRARNESHRREENSPHRKRFREDYESSGHRNVESRGRMSGSHMLFARMSLHLSPVQVYKLFDIQPGLESCDYNPVTGFVQAAYMDYPFMERAQEKLKTFEYPPGCPIVFTDPKGAEIMPERSLNSGSIEENFKNLIQTLEKATAVIQNSNYSLDNCRGPSRSGEWSNLSIPQEPLRDYPNAPSLDTPMTTEQVHFLSSPDLIPLEVLTDSFRRFGNLLKVEYLPGTLQGIAQYTSQESATQALRFLNGEMILGNRLKVFYTPSSSFGDNTGLTGRGSSH